MFKILFKILWSGASRQTRIAIRLSLVGIIVSSALTLVSRGIISGFRKEIIYHLTSFTGQISVEPYITDSLFFDRTFADSLKKKFPDKIKTAYAYVKDAALLKTKQYMEGITVLGVDKHWENSRIASEFLQDGKLFNLGKKKNLLIISETLADKLELRISDKPLLYFLQKPLKVRKVKIVAKYHTGMSEYDKTVAFLPIKTLQRVKKVPYPKAEGLLIELKPDINPEKFARELNEYLPFFLTAYTSEEKFPEIYDWLTLQEQNVNFIFLLVILVVIMNLTATNLIFTIEKLPHFSLLKALGASDFQLMKMLGGMYFLLVFLGIFIGNLLGFSLLLLQDIFEIIRLDPDTYFLEAVPVGWDFPMFAWLNLKFLFFGGISLLVPYFLLRRSSVIEVLRRRR